MKSFPICWNKTLTQLGFRRKVRKYRPKGIVGRRALFESLERREMLAVDGPVNTLLDVVDQPGLYSLRDAINDANVSSDADTITFLEGLTGTIVLNGSQLPIISQPLAIDGPGSDKLSVSGNNLYRVLQVGAGIGVTIEDLTIAAGKASGSNGGGVYNQGNLTLDHVVFVGNQASSSGGGIYSAAGASIDIKNTTFENNTSHTGGGARIHTATTGTVSISNSTFVDNTAAQSGGGLFIWGTAGAAPVYVTNSTFSGNEAVTHYSGAMRAQNGGLVNLVNCTIFDNTAGTQGGGLTSATQSKLVIHNSIIAGNHDPGTNGTDVAAIVESNSSYNLVGVSSDSDLNSGNDGNIAYNPAIPLLASLDYYGGPTKTHALLPGSQAIDVGSDSIAAAYGTVLSQVGLYQTVDTPNVGIPGTTTDIGSVPYADFELMVSALQSDSVDDKYFDGELSLREALNWAKSMPGHNTIHFSPDSDVSTILLTEPLVIDSDVTIEGPGANELTIDAQGNGAVIVVAGYPSSNTATIKGLTLTGGNNGAVKLGLFSHLNLDGVEITGNTGDTIRGIGSSVINITNSTIAENEGGIPIWTEYGGSLTVTNTTISNNNKNSSTAAAGAIRVYSTPALLTNVTITENRGEWSGGILVDEYTSLTMHNTIVAGNHVYNGNYPFDVYTMDPLGSIHSSSSNNLVGAAVPGKMPADKENQVGTYDYPIAAGLASLGKYGGPTRSHALLDDSLAIDAGDDSLAIGIDGLPLGTDQRGLIRSADSPGIRDPGEIVDIGAFESHKPVLQVDTLIDENDGIYGPGELSLREAIYLASQIEGTETITFSPTLFLTGSARIVLGDTDGDGTPDASPTPLLIDSAITLEGPGTDQLIIDAYQANKSVFAVYSATETLTVSISGLTVTGSNASTAIYNSERLVLDAVAVRDNYMTGIQNNGENAELTLTNSVVSGNDASGIRNDFGILWVTDSIIAGNTTWQSGGGIKNYGVATIERTTISDNSASQGGGIASSNHYSGHLESTLTIIDSTVSGNSAISNGGGIYILKFTDYDLTEIDPIVTATIINSTVSTNFAGGKGGGIYLAGGDLKLTNATIAYNKGIGGGLHTYSRFNYVTFYAIDGSVHADNTIIARNTLSDGATPSDVVSGLDFTPTSSHNLIEDATDSGGLTHDPGNGTANYNIVGVDPLLMPLGNYGGSTQTHALANGSPAIDAGSDSAADELATDQRGPGYERNIDNGDVDGDGSTVDIGAYEWPGFGDLIVNTLSDGEVAQGQLSLRQAIAQALPNQTISFSTDLDGEEIKLGPESDLIITKSLIIDATNLPQGLTLRAWDPTPARRYDADDPNYDINYPDKYGLHGDGGRLFLIEGDTIEVTLRGLTLTGGDSFESGGAIRSLGASLTLEDVKVIHNAAPRPSGKEIIGYDVTFVDQEDGAGYDIVRTPVYGPWQSGARGGGVFASGDLTIRSSYFANNATGELNSALGGQDPPPNYEADPIVNGEVYSGDIFSLGNLTIESSVFTTEAKDAYSSEIGVPDHDSRDNPGYIEPYPIIPLYALGGIYATNFRYGERANVSITDTEFINTRGFVVDTARPQDAWTHPTDFGLVHASPFYEIRNVTGGTLNKHDRVWDSYSQSYVEVLTVVADDPNDPPQIVDADVFERASFIRTDDLTPASFEIRRIHEDDSKTEWVTVKVARRMGDPFTAPMIVAPFELSAAKNTPLTFTAAKGNSIRITDPQGNQSPDGDYLTFTLSAVHGTLSLGSVRGLSNVVVAPGSKSISASGYAEDINNALEGLTYTPDTGFPEAGMDNLDSLHITVDDNLSDANDAVYFTIELSVIPSELLGTPSNLSTRTVIGTAPEGAALAFEFADLLPTITGRNTLTLDNVNVVDPRWGAILRYRPGWNEHPLEPPLGEGTGELGEEEENNGGYEVASFKDVRSAIRLYHIDADISGLTLHESAESGTSELEFGLHAMSSKVEIDKSKFLDSYALGEQVDQSHAIRVYGSELKVTNTVFQGVGGGILADSYCAVEVADSTFFNITHPDSGGVVRVDPVLQYDPNGLPDDLVGHLTIRDSVFRGNTLKSRTTTDDGAGVIVVSIHLGGINPSQPAGGNLLSYPLIIEGSRISDNRTEYGGSGDWGAAAVGGFGGGVVVHGPVDAFITGTTISNNAAANGTIADPLSGLGVGGGIAAIGARSLRIENSTISHNTASWVGGGIYSHHTDRLDLTNVTMVGNTAGYQGGGLFVVGGTLTDTGFPSPYSTFDFLDEEAVTLVNSIIAGNRAYGNGIDRNYYPAVPYSDHMDVIPVEPPGTDSNAPFAARFENTYDVWFALPASGTSHALSPESRNNIIGIGVSEFKPDGTTLFSDDEGHYDFALPISDGDIYGNQIGTLWSPIDPQLTPLGDYGGKTETHAIRIDPSAVSPAIDAGFNIELITPATVKSASFRSDWSPAYNLISEAVTLRGSDTVTPSGTPGAKYWQSSPIQDVPESALTPQSELVFGFHTLRELNSLVLWNAGVEAKRPRNIGIAFSSDGGDSWSEDVDVELDWTNVAIGASLQVDLADLGDYVVADAVRLRVLSTGPEGTTSYQAELGEVRFGGKRYDQRGGPFNRSVNSTQSAGNSIDIGAYESQVEYESLPGSYVFSGVTYDMEVANISDDVDLVLDDPNDLSLREAILLANIHAGHQLIALSDNLSGPEDTIHLTRGELQVTDFTTIAYAGASGRLAIDVSDSYELLSDVPNYPGSALPGRVELYGNPDTSFPVARPGERNVLGSRVMNIDDGFEYAPFMIDLLVVSNPPIFSDDPMPAENQMRPGETFSLANHTDLQALKQSLPIGPSGDYRYEIRNVIGGTIGRFVNNVFTPVTSFSTKEEFLDLEFQHLDDGYLIEPYFEIHRVMDVTLQKLELTGGLVQGSGGAVRTTEDLRIEKTVIHGNSAHELYNPQSTSLSDLGGIIPESVSPSGGGIYSEGARVTVDSSIIRDNSANYAGGGIYILGGQLVMSDSVVTDNLARDVLDPGSIQENPRKVSNDDRYAIGGGIAIVDAYRNLASKIENSTIDRNIALASHDYYPEAGGGYLTDQSLDGVNESYGGGVYVSNSVLDVVTSTVSNNEARYGGGLYAEKFLVSSATAILRMTGSTVSGNEALIRTEDGNLPDSNQSIYGGGIAVQNGADLHLVHSTVTANRVYNSTTTPTRGGGVDFQSWGQLFITHSIIADNPGNTGVNAYHDPPSSDIYFNGTAANRSINYSLIGDGKDSGLLQSFLTAPWDEGGQPIPDTNGNIIGGQLLGTHHTYYPDEEVPYAYRHFGGYVDPLLDVLAYNGGTTKTHGLLPQKGDPQALILPSGIEYSQDAYGPGNPPPTDVGGSEVAKLLTDPLVGYPIWQTAVVPQTLPYYQHEWQIESLTTSKVWTTESPGGDGSDYFVYGPQPVLEFDLGNVPIALSDFVVWRSASRQWPYSSWDDEAKTFELQFFDEEAPVGDPVLITRELSQDGIAEVYPLGSIYEATRVVVTITDNFYGATPLPVGYQPEYQDGNRVSLGQVRFIGQILDRTDPSLVIDAGGFGANGPDGISGTSDDNPLDQRGYPVVGTIDIGAYESEALPSESPPFAFEFVNRVNTIAENEDTSAGIKIADLLVSNLKGLPLTFNLTGPNVDKFELKQDESKRYLRELWIKPDVTIDFESLLPGTQLEVTVEVTDTSRSQSSSKDLELTVQDINDHPVLLVESLQLTLARDVTPETNPGVLVSSLLLGASDEDKLPTPDQLGIAVVATNTGDPSHGSLEYSLDAGASWRPVGAVSHDRALLINGGALLRFNMAEPFTDPIANAITFYAWDQTVGLAGKKFDTDELGTSLSLSSDVIGVSISPQVGQPVVVNSTAPHLSVNQVHPSVAVDARGNSVHVWRGDSPSSGIYGRRIDSNGNPIGDYFTVTTASTADPLQIVADSQGGILVIWREPMSGQSRVWANRFDLNGDQLEAAWPEPRLLTDGLSAPTWDGDSPASVVFGDGEFADTFMLQWQVAVAGSINNVYVQVFDSDGLPIGNAQVLVGNDQAMNQELAGSRPVYADGNFYAAWVEGNYSEGGPIVYVQKLDVGGVALGDAELVASASDVESTAHGANWNELRVISNLQLAAAADGGLIAGWQTGVVWSLADEPSAQDGEWHLLLNRRNKSGSWEDESLELATAISHSVDNAYLENSQRFDSFDLASDKDGRLGVAWTLMKDLQIGPYQIVTQWYDTTDTIAPIGEELGGPFIQTISVPNQWNNAQLAANNDGVFHLTAYSWGDTNWYDIITQRYELEPLNDVAYEPPVNGKLEITNDVSGTDHVELSVLEYGGDSYLGINGHLTEILASDLTEIVISGSSGEDIIDLRGLTGTSLVAVDIRVQGGDGADHIYVGEGSDIAVDGGLGDDTYYISDRFSADITLSDAGGGDKLHLTEWQGPPALIVLGYAGQQTITQGGGTTVNLTLAVGNEINSVTDDDSDPTEHLIFSSGVKPDLEVNTTADTLDDNPTNGVMSLREALLWAKTDLQADVIQFGTGFSEIKLDDELTVDTAVTIDGRRDGLPNVTLDGQSNIGHTHRIFHVTAGTSATIKNIKLTRGSSSLGGAIYAEGSLSLYGTVIENSSAGAGYGGGIAFAGATPEMQLRILDSIIQNNTADYGAGINVSSGTVVIVGSAILENISSAVASEGGGVRAVENANLSITNSTIGGNKAKFGGGIFTDVTGVAPTLTSVTVAYNMGDTGGGLRVLGTPVVAHGVLFAKNTELGGVTANNIVGNFGDDSSYNLVDHALTSGTLQDDEDGNIVGDIANIIETVPTTPADGTPPYYALIELTPPALNPAEDRIPVDSYGPGKNIPVVDQRGYVPPAVPPPDEPKRRDIGSYEAEGMPDTTDPKLTPIEATVFENAETGALVTKIEADPTWRNYTYTIVDGDPRGAFTIDSESGEITIADSSKLDAERVPGYLLTIKATENTGTSPRTAYGLARILVGDTPEAPTFNGPYSFEVLDRAYEGDLVGTVRADDPEGEELIYSLEGATDTFKINATTGEITVLDPAKLRDQSSVSFKVIATEIGDSPLSIAADVRVNILKVFGPELPPTGIDTPPPKFTVSHAGKLTFNPTASFANTEGVDYRVIYTNGSKTLKVDYNSEGVTLHSVTSQSLSLGELKVNADGTLTYEPNDNLQSRLTTPGEGGHYYFANERLSYRIVQLNGDQEADELVGEEDISVQVTNSLPVFRSDYIHRVGQESSLGHSIEVLQNVNVYRDRFYNIRLNELFYDPDGDRLEIVGFENPNPKLHSPWDNDDEPAIDDGGLIWAVVSSLPGGGSNQPLLRKLFVEKAQSDLIRLWQEGLNGDTHSRAQFGSLSFRIFITDGQSLSDDPVCFVLNVLPDTDDSQTQREVGPAVHTLEYWTEGGVSSPKIDTGEWSVEASDFVAGREGKDLQQVGDAVVDVVNGTLQRRHALTLDGSGGMSDFVLPGLIYDSATADPHIVVEATLQTQQLAQRARDNKITSIDATFTWYDHNNLSNNVATEYRSVPIRKSNIVGGESVSFIFNSPDAPTYTGVYCWDIVFEIDVDHGGGKHERLTITQTGESAVVVQKDSPAIDSGVAARDAYSPLFGDGWALEGVPQLFIDENRELGPVPDAADKLVLWFPGDSTRVFETFASDALESGQDVEFQAIDLETGLRDPLEYGKLEGVTVKVSEWEEEYRIRYTSRTHVIYEFEKANGSGEKAPIWRIARIFSPASVFPVKFEYADPSATAKLESIVTADNRVIAVSDPSGDFDLRLSLDGGRQINFEIDSANQLREIHHVLSGSDYRIRKFGYASSRMTTDRWYSGSTLERETSFEYDDTSGDNDGQLNTINYGAGSYITSYTVKPVLDYVSSNQLTEANRKATVTLSADYGIADGQSGNWLTEYVFDADNNVKANNSYFGSSVSASNLLTEEHWTYDHLHSVTSYVDALDRASYYTYDYQTPVDPSLRGEISDHQEIPTDGEEFAERVPKYDENDFRSNVTRINSFAGSTILEYETADEARMALGLLFKKTDPQGLITTYKRNSQGQLTELAIGDDYKETWTYFEPTVGYDGREITAYNTWLPESHTSALGLQTIYDYYGESDSNGSARQVKSVTTVDEGVAGVSGTGQTTFSLFTYDNNGYLGTETTHAGDSSEPVFSFTEFDYDESGLLRSTDVSDSTGSTLSRQEFEYDADGLLSKATDGNNITEYVYDKRGLLTELREAVGAPEAQTTDYSYYKDGSQRETELPDGTIITERYFPKDRRQSTTTSGVAVGLTSLDAQSGAITPALGEMTVTTTYDVLGRAIKEENGLTGALTEYAYHDVRHDAPTRITEHLNLGLAVRTGPFIDEELVTLLAYDQQGNIAYQENPGEAGRSFVFDQLGNLTESHVLAKYGADIFYDYDALGNVIQQKEIRKTPSAGQVTSAEVFTNYQYDESGRLRRTSDQADIDPTKLGDGDDSNDHLERTAKTDYGFIDLDHDDSVATPPVHVRVVTSTSREGVVTKRYVDAAGQLIRESNAYGGETAYEYDGAGNQRFIREKNPVTGQNERITELTYDGLNRVRETIQHGSAIDANRIVTHVDYYLPGQIAGDWDVVVADPLGVKTGTKYDSLGNIVASRVGDFANIDPANNDDLLTIYSYAYSAAQRAVATTIRTTSLRGEHDILNNSPRLQDETAVSRVVSNTRGDVLQSGVRVSGLNLSDELSATDLLANNIFPTGYEIRQTNRLEVTRLLAATIDGMGRTTTYLYDTKRTGLALVSSVQNAEQNVTYTYDSAGNRVSQNLPRTVTYDTADGTHVSRYFEDIIRWKYDDLGRVVEESATIDDPGQDPNSKEVYRTWRYEGLTTTRTDRNGESVTTTFHPAAGGPATTTIDAWTTDPGSPSYSAIFEHNADGSLRHAGDSWLTGDKSGDTSSVAYEYDQYGRISQETSNNKFNGVVAPTTVVDISAYHNNGTRQTATIRLVDGTGSTTVATHSYEIDSRGRISELTQLLEAGANRWASSTSPNNYKSATITYNANNQREHLDRYQTGFASGASLSSTNYSYRDDGNLSNIRHNRPVTGADGPLLSQYVFGYDESGRIDGIASFVYEGSGSGSTLHVNDTRTTYNYRAEVISIGPNTDTPLESATAANTAEYQRDNGSNVVGRNEQVGRLNRLYVDSEGHTYRYDDEGRLVEEKLDTGLTTRTYAWDFRGLLTKRTILGVDQEFHYDVLGRKVAYQASGPFGSPKEVYVLDGDDLAFELDVAGGTNAWQITRAYFNGPAPNEVLAIDQVYDTTSVDTVWLFPDHLGTVRTVGHYVETTSSGAQWQVLHVNVDQVGNTTFDFAGTGERKLGDTSVAVLDEVPVFFAGHQQDKFVMLYDTGSRWYDPRSQRHLSEDPRGYSSEAQNLYVYGGGDPVNIVLGERRPEFSFSAGTHGLLGLGGLIPGYGVVFDSLDAGLYYLEGQYVDAAFSAAAAIPGLGYLANAARGADAASQLYRASHVFDVGANLAESGYYGAEGYATGNRLQLGLSAFGLGVNARAASQLAGDAARAFHRNFEFSFDTSSAIAPNTFVGFVRPPLRIQRRADLAPDEVRLLQLQEDAARRVDTGRVKPGSTRHIELEPADNGAYKIEFESGMGYAGKGGTSRARRSARRISRQHDDPVKQILHFPADNDIDAFDIEATLLEELGGPQSPRNYNQRNSPGTQF